MVNCKTNTTKNHRTSKYLKFDVFCSNYFVGEETIASMKSTGRIPKEIFRFDSKKVMYVDYVFFTRRKNFQTFIMRENIENYFALKNYFTDTEIAKMSLVILKDKSKLATMQTYIGKDLFISPRDGVNNYRVTMSDWKFYRSMSWLIRRIAVLIANQKSFDIWAKNLKKKLKGNDYEKWIN